MTTPISRLPVGQLADWELTREIKRARAAGESNRVHELFAEAEYRDASRSGNRSRVVELQAEHAIAD